MAVFVKDPESRFQELGIGLNSFFDERRAARLEPAYRVRVNHETFFFADAREVEKFRADPVRFAGPLTDPVSGMRFVPAKTSPHAEHGGVTYYFLSEETHTVFTAAPDSFAQPKFHMMMPDSMRMRDSAALGTR